MCSVDRHAQLRTFLRGPYLVSFGFRRDATTFFLSFLSDITYNSVSEIC